MSLDRFSLDRINSSSYSSSQLHLLSNPLQSLSLCSPALLSYFNSSIREFLSCKTYTAGQHTLRSRWKAGQSGVQLKLNILCSRRPRQEDKIASFLNFFFREEVTYLKEREAWEITERKKWPRDLFNFLNHSKYFRLCRKLPNSRPSCSISHKISKSDSSGGEPVICQIHTSRQPRMIRNHMYTRLYQAPCQLCLTTTLLATDGISHEGPRFFTLVQPWRTSISFLSQHVEGIFSSSLLHLAVDLTNKLTIVVHLKRQDEKRFLLSFFFFLSFFLLLIRASLSNFLNSKT